MMVVNTTKNNKTKKNASDREDTLLSILWYEMLTETSRISCGAHEMQDERDEARTGWSVGNLNEKKNSTQDQL